jgi:hypothetical protein
VVAIALALLGVGNAFAEDEGAVPPQTRTMSIAALHSDLQFNLVAPARQAANPAVLALQQQAQRVLSDLQASAASLYPDALARVGAFEVFIANSKEISVMSSATGKIALNAGFSDLAPTDDWLALVLAREMAHVVAGHHDSNSAVSIITSVLMNLIVPGSGLIKSAVSFAGSQVASASGRERQLLEADGVALKLLEAAGYTIEAVALNLALGPGEARLGDTGWARSFATTSRLVVARGRPQLAPAGRSEERREPDAPTVASTSGRFAAASAPEEIVVARRRPSGLSGPLIFGGNVVPARLLD